MNPDDLKGPVVIDRERMDKALAGPFFTLPDGLTAEQTSAVLTLVGEITRQAVDAEREACADLMEQQHTWITNIAASTLIRARKDSA